MGDMFFEFAFEFSEKTDFLTELRQLSLSCLKQAIKNQRLILNFSKMYNTNVVFIC